MNGPPYTRRRPPCGAAPSPATLADWGLASPHARACVCVCVLVRFACLRACVFVCARVFFASLRFVPSCRWHCHTRQSFTTPCQLRACVTDTSADSPKGARRQRSSILSVQIVSTNFARSWRMPAQCGKSSQVSLLLDAVHRCVHWCFASTVTVYGIVVQA